MEILFELIVRILGEVLLQIVAEILFELGLRSLAAPFKQAPNPYLAAFGYVIFGAITGALSLFLIPNLVLDTHYGRVANLLITPLLAGAIMAALGAWRLRRDQELIRIDRFAYGYLFAVSMAIVRFYFGQ